MTTTEGIFQQFNGADLDRLVKCIQAVRAAGLSIDNFCSAGVNSNSGNVWLASEDWPGCVYCSIGFDVAWNWSCPNCGEEWDFATYAEMEEFARAQDSDTNGEGCKSCCDFAEEIATDDSRSFGPNR